MGKSLHELGDEYLAALEARITADTRVKNLLIKREVGPEVAAEWRSALDADYRAEQELTRARNAYQAAQAAGEN